MQIQSWRAKAFVCLVWFVFIGAVGCGGGNEGGFFGGGTAGGITLVDANGLPLLGATAYVPAPGGGVTRTAGQGSPLALVDGGGGTCDDPAENFLVADCSDTNGLIYLPCTGNTQEVKVQVNGEVAFSFTQQCNGQNETQRVPGVFGIPQGYGAMGQNIFVFDTVNDAAITNIVPVGNENLPGDLPLMLIDVATAPNGKAYATGSYEFLLGLSTTDLPGDPILGGAIVVIDTEDNTITDTVEVFGAVPFNLAVHPDGSKVYFTAFGVLDGIPDVGFLGILDTETLEVATQVLPYVFPLEIAFSGDGEKAILTGAEVSGPLGPGFGPAYAFFINTNFNTITNFADPIYLNSEGGRIAVNNDKAYIGGPFFLLGPSCNSTDIDVVDMTEEFLYKESLDLNGNVPDIAGTFYPLSLVSSPNADEVYVGGSTCLNGSAESVLATINTASDTFSNGFDLTPDGIMPLGLGISPDGAKVFIAYGGGGKGEDPFLGIFNLTTQSLSATTIPLPTDLGVFPPFNMSVQGGN